MPYLKPERPEKVSAPSLRASKERGERLVCLTAYDYPTARIVDEAGIDIILVGDSLGNVVLGYGNTVPVTLDEILIHVKAVRRGVERALLVADMPYGTPAEPGLDEEDLALLAEGMVAGREWMRSALQKTLAWVEENPGAALICAAGAGFIAGKLLLRRPRALEDLADE